MTGLQVDIVVPVRIEERDLAPSIWHLARCQTMISYTMNQQIASRLGADLFLLNAPGVSVPRSTQTRQNPAKDQTGLVGYLMTFPGVSVVIPTVGRSSVRSAVLSALDQTCPPLEVIVVVDTTECTVPPVLSDIADSIRVFFTGGIGASGARMRGVTESRGQFIAFLDDDDTWTPEKLERQLPELQAALATQRHAVVSCRFAVVNGDGKRLMTVPARILSPQERMASYLFRRTSLSISDRALATPTLMCDRELLDLEPWDSLLPRHQDWDWLLRVGDRHDVAIRMCPEVLVNVTVADKPSISRSGDWSASMGWLERRSARLTAREKGDFLLCHTAVIALRSGSRRGGVIAAAQAVRSGRPGLAAWLVWGIHMISPRLVDHASALHRLPSARGRQTKRQKESKNLVHRGCNSC